MEHRAHATSQSPELFLLFSVAFIGLFLFGIAYGVWIYARPVITTPSLIFADFVSSALLLLFEDSNLKSAQRFAASAEPHSLSWAEFKLLWSIVGGYLKWGVIALCLWFAYKGYKLKKSAEFKTVHSLESFIQFQARAWANIQPVTTHGARILNAKPGEGWGSALTPEEWVKRHKLMTGAHLDESRAERAFSKQLAHDWLGPEALPISLQLLCVAFLLLTAKEKTRAASLLSQLSDMTGKSESLDAALSGKGQKTNWANFAKAHFDHPKWGQPRLTEIMKRHAFVETAFMALLQEARRKSGVLPTSDFLWLKASHRGLYYALNAVGRRCFHVEALGVMAHYEAECDKGHLLVLPHVERAVESLADYAEAA